VSSLVDAIDDALSSVSPTVFDALVRAFGDADAEEQAALLNQLGDTLRAACIEAEDNDVDGFIVWQRQVTGIAAELDEHGRHLIAELALALEAHAEFEAAEASQYEEPRS